MSRIARALACAGLVLAVAASPASAHQGNPNFRSVVNGVTPSMKGVQVEVLGFDNQLQLLNRSGQDVVIYGYDNEPYAQILSDGTVEQNRNSPATYLNADQFGNTPVPARAQPSNPPDWQVLDKTGRYVWHDHRMHWMAPGTPPQVKQKSRTTKIFDYRIPMQVGPRMANLNGTLFWVGSSSSVPAGVIVFLVVFALVAVAFSVVVRRRRARGTTTGGREPRPAAEAW